MQANPHGKPAPTKSQVPGGGTRTRNGLGKSHRGFSWTCQREEKIPDHIIPVWSGRDHPPFHPSKCHSAGDNDHGSSRESSTPGSRSLAQLMEVVAPREGHRRAVTAHLAPPSTLCSFMGGVKHPALAPWDPPGILLGSSWDLWEPPTASRGLWEVVTEQPAPATMLPQGRAVALPGRSPTPRTPLLPPVHFLFVRDMG